MADPLHNQEFPEIGTRTTAPVGTGLEETRIDALAYEAPLEDPILKGEMNPDRQLPEGANQRLNRTAEQIGSALGKAVNQARRAPETARRGLHIVRERAQDASSNAADQLSTSTSSLAETAQQRARDFAGTAQQKARDLSSTAQRRAKELVDVAEERGRVLLDRAEDLGQRVSQKGTELKQQLNETTREVRAQTRLRAKEARLRSERLIEEKPLHVLGGIAAAAFVLGVSLRIVRSRNARSY
jgi:ElaB/YqjD/DUF883 family membrane-anchored ribosome-binding protein